MSEIIGPQEGDGIIPGDRDIPSVAHNRDYSKLGIAGFLAVGIMAIIFVAMDSLSKDKPQSLIAPSESGFKRSGSSALPAPYIEELPAFDESSFAEEYQEEKITKPARPDPAEIQMAQEAIKRAKEAEQEIKRRIASPQIVFDTKSSISAASSISGAVQPSAFASDNDPNTAFAKAYADQGVETAQARVLQNLDSLIPQGTLIDGILETAIQSDLPGMVRAIVSENIYSFDGSALLIPKGSRLIGRYNSSITKGQSRVFIIWNRLLRSDGVSINIGSIGADDLGRSGLGGTVDTHFFERFGSSVLLSLIDGGIDIAANTVEDNDSASLALDTGQNFSRASEIALDHAIAIKPTIHIPQGSAIKVFVGKDLDFSSARDLN